MKMINKTKNDSAYECLVSYRERMQSGSHTRVKDNVSEPEAVRAVGPGSLGSGTYGKVLDEVHLLRSGTTNVRRTLWNQGALNSFVGLFNILLVLWKVSCSDSTAEPSWGLTKTRYKSSITMLLS